MPTERDQKRLEMLDQLDAVLAERAKILAEKLALIEGDPRQSVSVSALTPTDAHFDEKLARLPLGESLITYLATCKKPQTLKQMAAALQKAGREFESKDPVRAVKDALKKTMVKNDDLFQIRWARWHLKSKTPRAKLEKFLAENATFGTAGRSSAQHGKRTRAAMHALMAKGIKLGAPTKMTPERIARAQEMLIDGKSVAVVAKELEVSRPSIYAFFTIDRTDGRRNVILKKQIQSAEEPKLRVVK